MKIFIEDLCRYFEYHFETKPDLAVLQMDTVKSWNIVFVFNTWYGIYCSRFFLSRLWPLRGGAFTQPWCLVLPLSYGPLSLFTSNGGSLYCIFVCSNCFEINYRYVCMYVGRYVGICNHRLKFQVKALAFRVQSFRERVR